MKKITLGILAHVDSGKTTLSEGILYKTGSIRKLGRVDHRDTFLDTHKLERERGITIFSKQAVFTFGDTEYTLLDTPGHADLSAETERTLQIIDHAVLVVSGTDPVQSHTKTIWELLKRYKIPTFIFVNKTDLPDVHKDDVMYKLKKRLSDSCVDFTDVNEKTFDELSLCSEQLMEQYLENGVISDNTIKNAISARNVFPCCFGSALKLEGIDKFLEVIKEYAKAPEYDKSFGAKIFKISEDDQGNRMTHMKITGGSLKVKTPLVYTIGGKEYSEKINQIRIYSGKKYSAPENVDAGTVCAVTGLSSAYPGMGLGTESSSYLSVLEPVIAYSVILPDELDAHKALQMLKKLEEEDPKLHVEWNEQKEEIQLRLMGQIQLEILQELFKERFGYDISFGEGTVSYRETISEVSEGVGHYEPLRHYAEVHLLLEPGKPGSGIVIQTDCREDKLDKNWQNLITTHLKEKQHLGILTGSPITDIKITLCSGKAHIKHTEGGDFRQATYRAVRNGLMFNKSVLLEPFYKFRLELPPEAVGRAINDIQQMSGSFSAPETTDEISVIEGEAPVSEMNGYHADVLSYTSGKGRLYCTVDGYRPCHNADEIIENAGYDPLADTENTPDSVFCSHGSGHIVKWNEVSKYMHLPSCLEKQEDETAQPPDKTAIRRYQNKLASDKELMEIFERTYGPIKQDKIKAFKKTPKEDDKKFKASPLPKGPEYLLVDGYNILFSWKRFKDIINDNIDLARNMLINILCSYQGYKQCELILVFDAYKVKGGTRHIEKVYNINVIYTKEAETADMYIEKITHEIGKKHRVRVATSDNLEQIIILGNGAYRISASEFEKEVEMVEKAVREIIQ